MDLQRIGIKLHAAPASSVEPAELVPLFHRWIQTSAVEGLLIDVADYGHVHHGPGVMLIAHEGHYALDLAGGRMGLLYDRKRLLEGNVQERLATVCRIALDACRKLEEAPELGGRLTFPGNELEIIASDRLLAPNSAETEAALRPAVSALLAKLYDGASCAIERDVDARERFTLAVRAPEPVPVGTLLRRLSA